MSQEGILKAVRHCRIQQLRVLLKFGVKLTSPDGRRASQILLEALLIDHPNKRKVMFRFLLRNGVNYNEVDNIGRDTLIWACYLGRETQAKDLLEYCLGDIDLCKRDKYGSTGLHYATQYGLKDVVEKLCKAMVKFNLSVDITNKDGNTPYLVAKILHRFEIMTILVNIGNASRCQVNIMDIDASYDNAKYQNTYGCEATECRVTVQEQRKGKQVSCRGTNKGNLTDRFKIYKCRVSKSKTISYTNVQPSQILENGGLAVKSETTKDVELHVNLTNRNDEKSSAGPLRSDQSSKQDITEYLHLLAIEKSGSFVKSAETCKLPKSAVPVNEASKLETPAKLQTVLPSINVLTRLKSRVKQLTGKGISEEQN